MTMPHLRLATLEDHKLTRLSRAGVLSEDGASGSRVETQIHQRQCLRCQRWFWAWSPERRKCFLCDPLPPEQLQRILGEIQGVGARTIEPQVVEVAGCRPGARGA